MHDPMNPTSYEIEEWAYAPEAEEPCQEWILALVWKEYVREYIKYVADPDCPNRLYFLDVLYYIIGSAVRGEFVSTPRPIIEGWLEDERIAGCADLVRWGERSRELLRNPSSFDFEYWCGRGHMAARD